MLRFKIQGNEYAITWKHLHPSQTDAPGSMCGLWHIQKDGERNLLATGSVYLHHKDTYIKRVGRKQAVARMLRERVHSVDMRRDIWNAYKAAMPQDFVRS